MLERRELCSVLTLIFFDLNIGNCKGAKMKRSFFVFPFKRVDQMHDIFFHVFDSRCE
jgi:hypothetical protein